jgi:hypothetical protein
MRSILARLATLILGTTMLVVTFSGCETIGGGVTARQFDQAWNSLSAGLTPEDVLNSLGEPREKRVVPSRTDPKSVWVYSRFEVVGTRTVVVEGAIGPGGTGIPTYEDEDVTAIVEFHLTWDDGSLVSWERIEPKSR